MPYKPLPKPVSARALQKRYADLAEITHKRIDVATDSGKRLSALLHRYFAAFSNLYGTISLRTAWELFRENEPELVTQRKLLKKDFLAFSDLLRVEALPYYILNIEEIWSEEPASRPIDRMIVNKKLVGRGFYRFHDLLVLLDAQADKPYLLLNKADCLAWAEPDHFRKSPYARDMMYFLSNLRVASDSGNCDIKGRPIHGKTLNKIIFWNRDEKFSYDYTSRKWEKEAIAAENDIIESEKLMRKIERNIQLGDPIISPAMFLHFLIDDLEEVGVPLSKKQLDKLLQLHKDLNNKSRLWCTRGWTPEELSAMEQPKGPPSISFGSGLTAAFARGDIDRTELEQTIREHGFVVADN